jgi:hypothetical protein
MAGSYVLDNFALVAGSAGSAHGPVKFVQMTFTGPTYNKPASPTPSDPTGVAGLAAGLDSLTGDGRAPIAVLQIGSGGDYALQYEPFTDRLVIKVASTGVEVADTVDLHAVTFRALVITV